MATMNKNNRNEIKKDTNTTLNHEGMVVHKLNALEEIMNRTLGSYMGESGAYDKTSPEKDFDRIKQLINEVAPEDAEYILKIAAIGRESGMISYPLAVLTACFNSDMFKGENFMDETGKNKTSKYADLVIRRGRDITDILSMQMVAYGFDVKKGKRSTPIPMQERKQLKRKLEEFDAYKISKALGESKMVSMADAVKLLRPGNKNDFFKQVIEGNVKLGNGKKQVQAEIAKVNNKNSESTVVDLKESIKDSSLIAIVKNLVALSTKNALDDGVTEVIVSKLTSKELVKNSKIMPYELYSAYRMIVSQRGKNIVAISNALVQAIDFSVENVDNIEGYSAIFVDLSGSMNSSVSEKSTLSCRDMAALLAAIALKKSCARVYAFADRCKEVIVSSASTIVDIAEKIKATEVGGSTYLMAALEAVASSGEKFDNVIVLSDGDAYSYDTKKGLILSNGYFGYGRKNTKNCDDTVSELIKKGSLKRFFINNLSARDFALVNTDDYRKNLVTGFTERYIDEINFSILLQRESGDVRNLIDILFDKYFLVKKK